MKMPMIKNSSSSIVSSQIMSVTPIIPNKAIKYRIWQAVEVFDPRKCLDNLCNKVQIQRILYSEPISKNSALEFRYSRLLEVIKEYSFDDWDAGLNVNDVNVVQ